MRSALALLGISLSLTCGCEGASSAPRVAPGLASTNGAAPPIEPSSTEITVTEDPTSDTWTVAITLPRPVMGLSFDRKRNHFRAATWKAMAEGGLVPISFGEREGHEVMLASGTTPFRQALLTFKSDVEEKNSDYLLNVAFTDGSKLFYTGHLDAQLLECSSQASCEASAATVSTPRSARDTRWHFRTTATRDILVLESRSKGALDWSPPASGFEDGTYAYFGQIAVADTPASRVVLDPGMPRWMVESATEYLPRVIDWYGKDTHLPLPFKPLIFVAFDRPQSSGRDLKGGGLDHVLQLRAMGSGWNEDTPETRSKWLEFLGHEVFHLWDGGIAVPKDDAGDAWISEGSANALSYRALLALGVIHQPEYDKLVVRAANRCLIELGRSRLDASLPTKPEYTCGAMLFAWIDGLARPHQQTSGDVLGRVFAAASARTDHRYGSADVLEAVAKLTGAASTEPFERILHHGVEAHADELFVSQFAASGTKVSMVKPSLGDVGGKSLLSASGVELAHCDCRDGRVSFWTRDDGLEFGNVPECSAISGIKALAVFGQPLTKSGAAAYEALVSRKLDRPITLKVDGAKAPLALTCRSDYQPPPFSHLLK